MFSRTAAHRFVCGPGRARAARIVDLRLAAGRTRRGGVSVGNGLSPTAPHPSGQRHCSEAGRPGCALGSKPSGGTQGNGLEDVVVVEPERPDMKTGGSVPGNGGGYPPPPLHSAQPMPSHCPLDAKCQP